jgi:hypothetical protein
MTSRHNWNDDETKPASKRGRRLGEKRAKRGADPEAKDARPVRRRGPDEVVWDWETDLEEGVEDELDGDELDDFELDGFDDDDADEDDDDDF